MPGHADDNSSTASAVTPQQSTSCSADGRAVDEEHKSALQDNIERRGKNAYYYAHSHKANGPAWDGKAEPKLLSKHEVQHGHLLKSSSTFDYAQSNITTYAFLDDGPKVKLYIDFDGVGEKCRDTDVSLDYTEKSLCLKIQNYQPTTLCLCFAKLSGAIVDASFKLKSNRIILTLTKCRADEIWHTINDKGAPDHEVV